MEVSGEVADLLVKEGLEAAKIAAELSAKGLVNVAVLLTAMVKQNYKVVGKVGIKRLLRDSNTESVIIPIKTADYDRFQKIAKQFGVLYAAVTHEVKETGVMHIVSNANYSAQLNAVLQAMDYAVPEVRREKQSAKKRSPALNTGSPPTSAGLARTDRRGMKGRPPGSAWPNWTGRPGRGSLAPRFTAMIE